MSEHIEDARLNAYVDGELSAADAAAVERHAAACAACGAELAAARRLAGDLSRLPASVAPPRDLRWDIRRRLAEPEAAGGPVHRWRLLAAAAAVVLLMAATALVTRWVVTSAPAPSPAATAAAGPSSVRLAGFRDTERDYMAAIAELEAVLKAEGAGLSPATVDVIESSLAAIDRALAEARAALERDPLNAAVSEMMLATYRQKLDLLRRARATSS